MGEFNFIPCYFVADFLRLFKANDNQISNWNCIDELAANTKLVTVYLERNPLAKDVQYRKKLMLALPQLKQIDAALCASN